VRADPAEREARRRDPPATARDCSKARRSSRPAAAKGAAETSYEVDKAARRATGHETTKQSPSSTPTRQVPSTEPDRTALSARPPRIPACSPLARPQGSGARHARLARGGPAGWTHFPTATISLRRG
jgi:hypothetical protein